MECLQIRRSLIDGGRGYYRAFPDFYLPIPLDEFGSRQTGA